MVTVDCDQGEGLVYDGAAVRSPVPIPTFNTHSRLINVLHNYVA